MDRSNYEKYLFKFEKLDNEPTKLRLLESDGVKIDKLKPELLLPVPIFRISKKEDLTKEMIREILSKDVCILRNFEIAMGIKSTLFDAEVLGERYGDAIVDIVN